MATGVAARCLRDARCRQCIGKRLSRAIWSSFNKERMSHLYDSTVAGPTARRDNVLASKCEYPPFRYPPFKCALTLFSARFLALGLKVWSVILAVRTLSCKTTAKPCEARITIDIRERKFSQSLSDRSFWKSLRVVDVRAFGSWMSAPKCLFFSRILSALTEVLGRDIRANDPRMSARDPSPKLPLWANFSSDH